MRRAVKRSRNEAATSPNNFAPNTPASGSSVTSLLASERGRAPSSFNSPHARPADEIVRRLFDSVRPTPHLRHLLARHHLGNGVRRQIADDVVLVVILTAEDARAARRDVQMQ